MSLDPASGGHAPREVPAKSLPVPATVSPRLRRSISDAALAPAGAFLRSPRTLEQWRGLVAAIAAQGAERLPALLAARPTAIAEQTLGGVTVRRLTPPTLSARHQGRLFVHLHGGAYVMSGGEAGIGEGVLLAHAARAEVISVDYRMPPDHPFPAAVDDAVAVWRALIETHDPAAIGVFGTSAGGGLLLAMVLRLKALGLPLPGALAPGTPWADLAGLSDSYQVNAHVDGVLPHYPGVLEACARLYAGEAPLDDPLVSPVHGDFAGFPPCILTSGTRDILLSDTTRVYRALRAAGVEARLELHEAMSHAEYNQAWDSPESEQVFADIVAFLDAHLKG